MVKKRAEVFCIQLKGRGIPAHTCGVRGNTNYLLGKAKNAGVEQQLFCRIFREHEKFLSQTDELAVLEFKSENRPLFLKRVSMRKSDIAKRNKCFELQDAIDICRSRFLSIRDIEKLFSVIKKKSGGNADFFSNFKKFMSKEGYLSGMETVSYDWFPYSFTGSQENYLTY